MLKKFVIFGGIGFIIAGIIIYGAAYYKVEAYNMKNLTDYSENFNTSDIKSLYINYDIIDVTLKSGPAFRVEANSIIKDQLICEVSGGVLKVEYIKPKISYGWFNVNLPFFNVANDSNIIIYIPDDVILENVDFKAGVGVIVIEGMSASNIYVDMGVGDFRADKLICEKLTISGGVGSVKINGIISDGLDFNGGVGDLNITGEILGQSRIESGVGSVRLNLSGNIDDYAFDFDVGLGSVNVNSQSYKSFIGINSSYNKNAPYSFDVNSGVGDVNINIK